MLRNFLTINKYIAYGYTQFKADVLAENKGMNYVFQHTGIPFTRRADFGVFTYIFDLSRADTVGNEILYNSPFVGPN